MKSLVFVRSIILYVKTMWEFVVLQIHDGSLEQPEKAPGIAQFGFEQKIGTIGEIPAAKPPDDTSHHINSSTSTSHSAFLGTSSLWRCLACMFQIQAQIQLSSPTVSIASNVNKVQFIHEITRECELHFLFIMHRVKWASLIIVLWIEHLWFRWTRNANGLSNKTPWIKTNAV